MKRLLLLLIGAITLLSASAQERVTMLTREGNLYEIKLDRITNDDVQYYVKKNHVKGYSSVEKAHMRSVLQTSPKEEIFMIKYDNGNTIFFLENGTQISRKSVKVADNDDVLYLRDGQEVVVRDLLLSGKEVSFKAPNRKEKEVYSMPKSQIFMVRHSDGFCDIFGPRPQSKAARQPQTPMVAANNANAGYQPAADTQPVASAQVAQPQPSAQAAQPVAQNQARQTPSASVNVSTQSNGTGGISVPTVNVPSVTVSNTPNTSAANTQAANTQAANTSAADTQAANTSAAKEQSPEPVQVSAPARAQAVVVPTSLSNAYGMFPEKVIEKVYKSNPYTLYKRNAIAEYTFSQNNRPIKYCGAAYLMQHIIDARVEDGLYIAYLQQDILDEHRQRPAGVDERYFESIFVTEIDTAGTFNWTHDPLRTQMVVDKKRGYASLIHNYLTPGPLKTSKMEITGFSHTSDMKGNKGSVGLFSLSTKPSTILYDYSGLKVVGFDKISTPCGIFDCVCISGHIPGMLANGNVKTAPTTIWLSRGVGIVRCDVDIDNNGKPITMILNNIYNNED